MTDRNWRSILVGIAWLNLLGCALILAFLWKPDASEQKYVQFFPRHMPEII